MQHWTNYLKGCLIILFRINQQTFVWLGELEKQNINPNAYTCTATTTHPNLQAIYLSLLSMGQGCNLWIGFTVHWSMVSMTTLAVSTTRTKRFWQRCQKIFLKKWFPWIATYAWVLRKHGIPPSTFESHTLCWDIRVDTSRELMYRERLLKNSNSPAPYPIFVGYQNRRSMRLWVLLLSLTILNVRITVIKG